MRKRRKIIAKEKVEAKANKRQQESMKRMPCCEIVQTNIYSFLIYTFNISNYSVSIYQHFSPLLTSLLIIHYCFYFIFVGSTGPADGQAMSASGRGTSSHSFSRCTS
jgi:hypothetical protein